MSLLPTPFQMSLLDVFRSLHCIPLKFLECFWSAMNCLVEQSILQSFRDTGSLWGSRVRALLFFFIHCENSVLCTDMENIQAINASMSVWCQAVLKVKRRAHIKSHYSEKWHLGGLRGHWGRQIQAPVAEPHISAVCLVTGYQVVSCSVVRYGWLKDAHRGPCL